MRYRLIKKYPGCQGEVGDVYDDFYFDPTQWPEFYEPAITFKKRLPKLSTLQDEIIVPGRRKGNTTRQVNLAIDSLFKGFEVYVTDHWEEGNRAIANSRLYKRILDRIREEHYNITEHLKVGKESLRLSDQILEVNGTNR